MRIAHRPVKAGAKVCALGGDTWVPPYNNFLFNDHLL